MDQWLKHSTCTMKLWTWGCCVIFCVVSGVGFLWKGNILEGLICLGTVVLISLPFLLERCWNWTLNRGFFLFCLLYAMGPMLGKAFKLYYLTNWWDKLLHTSAGFLFAVLGTYLTTALNNGKETSPILQILFGICFSIAVSAVWELVEFGVDRIFGADMQNDAIVNSIHSYLLSDTPGMLWEMPEITSLSVNGTPLEIGGYLDIGLIDTMHDVLVETTGAVVYGVWHLLDRNRHPLICTVC